MTANITAEERRRMIAEAAWNRAVARGFADGDPVSDWLAAEREVDARLDGPAEDWLAALQGRLATVRAEFKGLKKRAGPRAKAAKAEWQKNVGKLEKLLDKFGERVELLSERGEKATQKARTKAEKVWDDITELRQRLGKKPM